MKRVLPFSVQCEERRIQAEGSMRHWGEILINRRGLEGTIQRKAKVEVVELALGTGQEASMCGEPL